MKKPAISTTSLYSDDMQKIMGKTPKRVYVYTLVALTFAIAVVIFCCLKLKLKKNFEAPYTVEYSGGKTIIKLLTDHKGLSLISHNKQALLAQYPASSEARNLIKIHYDKISVASLNATVQKSAFKTLPITQFYIRPSLLLVTLNVTNNVFPSHMTSYLNSGTLKFQYEEKSLLESLFEKRF